MTPFTLGAMLPLIVLAPAPAASVSGDEAAALVRRLGDSSFKVRDDASKQLLRLGRAAKDALLAGKDDPDAEISARCARLLPAVLKADLESRLQAFVADKDGRRTHDLPGWGRFKKLTGGDPAAKDLYVELVRADFGLLPLVEENAGRASEQFEARCVELQQRLIVRVFNNTGLIQPPQLPLADVALLLFVGSDERVRLEGRVPQMVYSFVYQQTVQPVLKAEGNNPARKLLVAWIQRGTPSMVSQSLSMIQNFNLTECSDFVAKLVADKDVTVVSRAQAMTTLGKLDRKEALPALRSLLADDTQVGKFQFGGANAEAMVVQLRDVALAMTIVLSGETPRDYGFESLQNNTGNTFYYHQLGFSSDEKRKAAFKKWEEKAASLKKPEG